MATVREKVEEYFASINPIAKRIMDDMSLVKQQCDWESLSTDEQEDAVWRALVHPEVEKKLLKEEVSKDVMECFPALRMKTGARIIVDEEASAGKPFGISWRDEHSAPFSWETQSQMDLTLFGTERIFIEKPRAAISASSLSTAAGTPREERRDDVKRSQTIKRPSVPPPPVPPHASPPVPPHAENSPPVPPHADKSETPIYAKVVKRKVNSKTLNLSEIKAHRKAMEEMKPVVPPRMSLELLIDVNPGSDVVDSIESIPKTGFDFLDNW